MLLKNLKVLNDKCCFLLSLQQDMEKKKQVLTYFRKNLQNFLEIPQNIWKIPGSVVTLNQHLQSAVACISVHPELWYY